MLRNRTNVSMKYGTMALCVYLYVSNNSGLFSQSFSYQARIDHKYSPFATAACVCCSEVLNTHVLTINYFAGLLAPSMQVRANGVRTLGSLITLTGFVGDVQAPDGDCQWIEPLLQCLLSSLTTG